MKRCRDVYHVFSGGRAFQCLQCGQICGSRTQSRRHLDQTCAGVPAGGAEPALLAQRLGNDYQLPGEQAVEQPRLLNAPDPALQPQTSSSDGDEANHSSSGDEDGTGGSPQGPPQEVDGEAADIAPLHAAAADAANPAAPQQAQFGADLDVAALAAVAAQHLPALADAAGEEVLPDAAPAVRLADPQGDATAEDAAWKAQQAEECWEDVDYAHVEYDLDDILQEQEMHFGALGEGHAPDPGSLSWTDVQVRALAGRLRLTFSLNTEPAWCKPCTALPPTECLAAAPDVAPVVASPHTRCTHADDASM